MTQTLKICMLLRHVTCNEKRYFYNLILHRRWRDAVIIIPISCYEMHLLTMHFTTYTSLCYYYVTLLHSLNFTLCMLLCYMYVILWHVRHFATCTPFCDVRYLATSYTLYCYTNTTFVRHFATSTSLYDVGHFTDLQTASG